MNYLLQQTDLTLKRIKQLTPQNIDTKEFLRNVLDQQLENLSDNVSLGIPVIGKKELYSSARFAVEDIDAPEKLLSEFQEGIPQVLGVIEWLLRPSFPLKGGYFDHPSSGPWVELSNDLVVDIEKAICRLDIQINNYSPFQIGTGFVVGKDAQNRALIMTNMHVIEGAQQLGWLNSAFVTLGCAFERYSLTSTDKLYPLLNLYEKHSSYDLALVYLQLEDAENIASRTNILNLSTLPPDSINGIKIGVIGHPYFDSRLDPFPKYYGFGDEFGIKRFSPGELKELNNREWHQQLIEIMVHDAATLSGSSGSCIFDLQTKSVLGLHFGGWQMPNKTLVSTLSGDIYAQLFYDNGAVPLWKLVNEPILKEANYN
jgi:V8-like Glu-specific endopeptidase